MTHTSAGCGHQCVPCCQPAGQGTSLVIYLHMYFILLATAVWFGNKTSCFVPDRCTCKVNPVFVIVYSCELIMFSKSHPK